MIKKEIHLDNLHSQEQDKDGHPMVICWNELGHNHGCEVQLHYDDQREVYWCDSCCSSFEQPKNELISHITVKEADGSLTRHSL